MARFVPGSSRGVNGCFLIQSLQPVKVTYFSHCVFPPIRSNIPDVPQHRTYPNYVITLSRIYPGLNPFLFNEEQLQVLPKATFPRIIKVLFVGATGASALAAPKEVSTFKRHASVVEHRRLHSQKATNI